MQDKPRRFTFWSSMITNKEEAEKVIKETAYSYYFLALLEGAIGIFTNPLMLTDSVLMIVMAFCLQRFKKRWLAIVLMVYGFANLVLTVVNRVMPNPTGGTNVILAIIYAWVGVRAVKATIKLHKLQQDIDTDSTEQPQGRSP